MPTNYAIFHHSATPLTTADSVIAKWKYYNRVIKPDGTVVFKKESLNPRRDDNQSFDICVVGNFEIEQPTQSQIEMIKCFWRFEKGSFEDILGHSEINRFGLYSPKTGIWPTLCPGKNLLPFIQSLRQASGNTASENIPPAAVSTNVAFLTRIYRHPNLSLEDENILIQAAQTEGLKYGLDMRFTDYLVDYDFSEAGTSNLVFNILKLNGAHCAIALFRTPRPEGDGGTIGGRQGHQAKLGTRFSPPQNIDINSFIHELTHLIFQYIDDSFNDQIDLQHDSNQYDFRHLAGRDLNKIPTLS